MQKKEMQTKACSELAESVCRFSKQGIEDACEQSRLNTINH
jgi:hypothetical protein